MLQNATLLRKSAPGPPNISDEHVSCAAPATRNASFQILFKCPTPAMLFGNATKPSRFAHFWQGAQSLAPAARNDIWTSKSGANMWCFVHFDFEVCLAPQRRAIFVSHLASWLRTRRFSELLFRPSGATNHWKNTVLRDFPTFSRTWIFFLLRLSIFVIFFLLLFSSLTLPISAFHLSILSEVWLLNFLRLEYIRVFLESCIREWAKANTPAINMGSKMVGRTAWLSISMALNWIP